MFKFDFVVENLMEQIHFELSLNIKGATEILFKFHTSVT
jgi:hypothetical protein